MYLRRRALSMTGFVLLVLIGAGPIDRAEATTFKVIVRSGAQEFLPQQMTIAVGDTVSWMNEDQNAHFLISSGSASQRVAGERTGNLAINALLHPAARYSHTFEEAGTYYYFCANHMQMWGMVIVEQ